MLFLSQQESGAFVWTFVWTNLTVPAWPATCICISTCPKYSLNVMADGEGILHHLPGWQDACVFIINIAIKCKINKWVWAGVIWDLRASVLHADYAESPQTPGGVNLPTPHRGETSACGVAGTNLWSPFSPAVLKQNTDFSFLHPKAESGQPEFCLTLEIRRDDARDDTQHSQHGDIFQ